MKGIIFKCFEQHIINHFGEDVLDSLLDQSDLSSGGAYTSVGNYPPNDLICMVNSLSTQSGKPIGELINGFGNDLFFELARLHREIMAQFTDCLDMLAGIESIIHRNVQKLYSDAELPQFSVQLHEKGKRIILIYSSVRPFADLAHGLIQGALRFYGLLESATILREDLSVDGTKTQFDITLSPGGAR